MLGSNADLSHKLLAWYDASKRDLPWRNLAGNTPYPDPYHVLVSELMLQQTQVATVIPYFERFLTRFPTLPDLARSPLQEVLVHWQGLGYYSRARNLHKAANLVLSEHSGVIPGDLSALLKLPGVGRYTAGAVASIAFGRRTPILDGNVTRVLCRLDSQTGDPRDRQVLARLWERAEEILPENRIGDFNSALMELGATICIPRNPQCLVCPVKDHCKAVAAGLQDQIPPAKQAVKTPLERRVVLCIRHQDQWLIEQRPPTGRWAGLWQFPTRPKPTRSKPETMGLHWPVAVSAKRRLGTVRHALTHRRYQFDVYWCETVNQPPIQAELPSDLPHVWVKLDQLSAYPLSKPQLTIGEMLRKVQI